MYQQSYHEWFKAIKRDLLLSEPQNIAIRAHCCESIINETVSQLNGQLHIKQLPNHLFYSCRVNTAPHLEFLINWPGLRISPTSIKAPRSRREYEKKSKNWLNGRRAPNYSKTLFPFFIHESEQYTLSISQYLHPNNYAKQSLYYNILINHILAGLCGCCVSFNDQAKKAPFFCKNSVERKGKLRDILQSYAADHQYTKGFPSCAEEAVDYFESKALKNMETYNYKYINSNINNEKSAKYWKEKALQLQGQLVMERHLRSEIEKERDRLQSIYNRMDHSTDSISTQSTDNTLITSKPQSLIAIPYIKIDINKTKTCNEENGNDLGRRMVDALFKMLKTN